MQDHSKWVVCRVYEEEEDGGGTELSCLDEVFLSLDDLDEISFPNSWNTRIQKKNENIIGSFCYCRKSQNVLGFIRNVGVELMFDQCIN